MVPSLSDARPTISSPGMISTILQVGSTPGLGSVISARRPRGLESQQFGLEGAQ
jgi:hypothetical protein